MLRHTPYKIATHHTHEQGRIFSWLSLITGIGNGIVFTIFPLILLEKLQSESSVGYYYSIIAVIILVASIYSTVVFQKFSKVTIAKATLFLTILALLSMTFAEQIWHIAGLDIPRIICIITFGVALNIFISDFTKKKDLGKAEGKFYMFSNIGLLIGPLIGGYASKYFGHSSIFVFAAIFYIIALVLFQYQHIYQKHPHIEHGTHKEGIGELFSNIKSYFKNKEFRKVFLVSLGLNFWWKVSIIYIPLEISNLGFSDNIVGWVIALSAVPLILLERFAGKFADNRSIRLSITLGFSILAFFAFFFPLLYSKPYLLLLAFCAVNIGAAWIEPIKETYFFKIAKKSEREKFFGIYNASQPISSILSPLLCGFLYSLGGSNGLWIGTGAFLGLFILNGLWIKK